MWTLMNSYIIWIGTTTSQNHMEEQNSPLSCGPTASSGWVSKVMYDPRAPWRRRLSRRRKFSSLRPSSQQWPDSAVYDWCRTPCRPIATVATCFNREYCRHQSYRTTPLIWRWRRIAESSFVWVNHGSSGVDLGGTRGTRPQSLVSGGR